MNRISIHIESDGFNPEQAQALATFAATLKPTGERHFKDEPQPVSCGTLKEAIQEEQTVEDKPKATRNRSKKVETVTEELSAPEEQAVANEVETVAEEVGQEEEDDLMGDDAPETALTVTREMVRSKVSDKQAAHKDAIRAKLKDLGAENVTKLEDKHFGDFYAFLNKLA